MKSTLQTSKLHVAIIMDGNGRWAAAQGMPRAFGHRAGAETVRRVVEAAPDLGIGTLTLYAFSSDNWKRPAAEVGAILSLFQQYLVLEEPRMRKDGVRLSVIGRRDRLPPELLGAIEVVEDSTRSNDRVHLRLAVDYSARDAILTAARALGGRPVSREAFGYLLAGGCEHEVDLLIRTGGEQRLSDFLLWECAYAEFHFTDVMWPDFTGEDLHRATQDFRVRERRFGGLTEPVILDEPMQWGVA